MARLGYERYAAQGGDWGSIITAALGSTDPRHYRELDSGGHFASLEHPEAFVDELRTFFRPLS